MSNRDYYRGDGRHYRQGQTHVHEFEESVKLAEQGQERHNHRAAGVTDEAIPVGNGRHVHRVAAKTDFGDHYHQIYVTTGIDIPIPGTNKHVHLVAGPTTIDDGHLHEFAFTTQIEAPTI